MKLAVADLFDRGYEQWSYAFLRGLRDKGFHSIGFYEAPLLALGKTGRSELKKKLGDAGLGVHSWFVACHTHIRPDDPRRAHDLDRFRESAELAAYFGAESVGTSPGSYDERHHWTAHPKNFQLEALELVAASLRQIVPFFEERNVKLGLEFGVPTAVDTIDKALWLVKTVGSAQFGVYADPANHSQGYERIFRSGEIMQRFFALLGDHVLCAHARDAWLEPGLDMHIRTGGPGDGILDFHTFLGCVRDRDPAMSLLIEHAPQERIDNYVQYLRAVCAEIGLEIEP